MPFISKDWRSPGENWIKVGSGWEREKDLQFNDPPHFRITQRKSRENRNENTLSEALQHLSFQSSSHNIRRFNYICKLLVLLSNNYHVLPGNVQKMVLEILKQLILYTKETRARADVIQFILDNVKDNSDKFWGGNLGSHINWENHKLTLRELSTDSNSSSSSSGSDSENENEIEEIGSQPITHLPEEIIRCILLKLDHHSDIMNFSKSHEIVEELSGESRIWRELCRYHFAKNVEIENLRAGETWVSFYHRLKRKYGLKEENYADFLCICRHCGLLFWNNFTECSECGNTNLLSLKPNEFLEFFSV